VTVVPSNLPAKASASSGLIVSAFACSSARDVLAPPAAAAVGSSAAAVGSSAAAVGSSAAAVGSSAAAVGAAAWILSS
jgi:hypothetical protein